MSELSFFPRGVLDDILNLIESVSEGFPTYTCTLVINKACGRMPPIEALTYFLKSLHVCLVLKEDVHV